MCRGLFFFVRFGRGCLGVIFFMSCVCLVAFSLGVGVGGLF